MGETGGQARQDVCRGGSLNGVRSRLRPEEKLGPAQEETLSWCVQAEALEGGEAEAWLTVDTASS